MAEYRPNGPLIIKSGANEGKSLESLMFQKYWLIKWWVDKLDQKNPVSKNQFHQHLEWLIQQGENRRAEMLCPQCNQESVKFFSSLGNERYGYSIYSVYTCCGSNSCRERLISQSGGSMPLIFPVKFSSILNYRKKFDQKMVVDLLKAAYKMPKRITAQVAFEFFAK